MFVCDVQKDKTSEVVRREREREEGCEKMACGLGRNTLIGHVENSSVIPVELIMMVHVRRLWNAKTPLGDPCKTKIRMLYISLYAVPLVV